MSGAQNYNMRAQGINENFERQNQVGSALPRQSRSRQKIMKTNTYALNNQDSQTTQNNFAPYQAKQMKQNQQSNPYDNAIPNNRGGEMLAHHSVNAARNTFYVSDNQRQKANLFKDLNPVGGTKQIMGGQKVNRSG